MSAAPKDRQPWPMKWIVLAILLVLVPYTIINLRYRKENKAFEPYADMKDRANTVRLLSAGYQRITLTAERPADPLKGATSASFLPGVGGLPDSLRTTLVNLPLLPADITNASAPAAVNANEPYAFRFACTLPDQKRQLSGAELYIRGEELVVTPDYEKLSGELLARTADNVVQLTIPAGTLKPGRYRATLVGANSSRMWWFDVK